MENKKIFLQIGALALLVIVLREGYKWKVKRDLDQAKKKLIDDAKGDGLILKKELAPTPRTTQSTAYEPQIVQGIMSPTINDFETGKPYVQIPVKEFDMSAIPKEINAAIF